MPAEHRLRKLLPLASTVTDGVWRLFGVAASLFVVFLGILYWNIHGIMELAEAVDRTETIERELYALGEDLLRAETGQRGYILTGDEAYLQSYLAVKDVVPRRIMHLRALIRNPTAAANLERMEPIIAAKMEELAETVGLARQGRQEAALAVVRADHGRQLMDQFRQVRATTLDLGRHLLAERRADFTAEFNLVLITVILGGAATLVLLFVSAAGTAARLKEPIQSLLVGIQAMGDGQFEGRVEVASDDEIGHISAAFNAMAARALATRHDRDAILAELERSNAELDRFAYVASHDLRAPLRGIRNLALWIEEDVAGAASDDTRDYLRLLKNRVDRLDNLLESLLTYSRVGRDMGADETVDTGRLVGEIADYLAPPAGFTIECRGDMPILRTPRAPLELVLRNLISNALKHHDRQQGRVEVSARDGENAVRMRVEDDGPGIPPEFHGRIFDMFQTLKPRDQVEGSGMGLAIVKKTVESLGGEIRVESPLAGGRGTAFEFTWLKILRRRVLPA